VNTNMNININMDMNIIKTDKLILILAVLDVQLNTFERNSSTHTRWWKYCLFAAKTDCTYSNLKTSSTNISKLLRIFLKTSRILMKVSISALEYGSNCKRNCVIKCIYCLSWTCDSHCAKERFVCGIVVYEGQYGASLSGHFIWRGCSMAVNLILNAGQDT
jgi:hypothetical protein